MIRPLFPLVALLTFIASASAQQRPPFQRGTWDLELTGAYVTPIRFSDDKLWDFNVAGGYYLWQNISLSGELQGYYADQPNKDAVIAGAGVLARWHFLSWDRFSWFIDGGGGVTYASREVPEFGTHFNFTGKGGFGMTYRLNDDIHLIGGARYFHLSNGNIHGRDQNPSYDGIQFYAGVMFTF